MTDLSTGQIEPLRVSRFVLFRSHLSIYQRGEALACESQPGSPCGPLPLTDPPTAVEFLVPQLRHEWPGKALDLVAHTDHHLQQNLFAPNPSNPAAMGPPCTGQQSTHEGRVCAPHRSDRPILSMHRSQFAQAIPRFFEPLQNGNVRKVIGRQTECRIRHQIQGAADR
jgi:hypothetical protein